MPEEITFKRFSQGDEEDSQKHYFIMCTLHENLEDFEDSRLDLVVTSNHRSWAAKGLKKPKTPHAEALRRIHMALSSKHDPDIAFRVQLTEKKDILQVVCAWKDKGKEVFQRHQPFELKLDADDGAATRVFDALIEKCESFQDASKNSTGRLEDFKTLAEESQRLVQDYVTTHGQREEDMYLKFAAVLNEKKKRIRELESEVALLRKTAGSGKGTSEAAHQGGYQSEETAVSEPQADDASEAEDEGNQTEDEAKDQAASLETEDEDSSQANSDVPSKPGKKRKK